jgi:putative heme iron utilization protein
MPRPAAETEAVRALVARERDGVLSTLHGDHGGWPFGSVVLYALTAEGDPVLLLSDVAEHTRNLRADARASLLVRDSGAREDPQAGARATLLARASVPTGREGEGAAEAYFARFPEARAHLAAHGFRPHVLRVERVRWIAGFGSMGWLDRDAWLPPSAARADAIEAHAKAILDHMNADHAGALLELAAHHGGATAARARMTGIDARGLDVEAEAADGSVSAVRVPFAREVTTPDEARKAVRAALASARAARGAGGAATG